MHEANEKIISFIKDDMERNAAAAETEKTISEGELERRRMVFKRAAEIICARLAQDATAMEDACEVSDDLTKRHQLMDSARCLRVTVTWLQNEAELVKKVVDNGTGCQLARD